ncbi:hypothetical protein D3C87_1808560 [compost metagenome]
MFAIIDADIGMLRSLSDIRGVELQKLSATDTGLQQQFNPLANCVTAIVPETDSPQRPGESVCE